MKVNLYSLIVFGFQFIKLAIAQENKSGIYITSTDFLNKNLLHASTTTHIKSHELFKKNIIEVKCNDSTFIYSKKDIFGYVDKYGNTYRFFDGNFFSIINPGEKILIYQISNGPVQKGQSITYSYYFSKNVNGKLIPLTLCNLLTAFTDNPSFQYTLEIHFNSQSSLLEYDNFHKQYKINLLLEMSENEKH